MNKLSATITTNFGMTATMEAASGYAATIGQPVAGTEFIDSEGNILATSDGVAYGVYEQGVEKLTCSLRIGGTNG